MKKVVTGAFCLLMTACASSPTVVPVQQGYYIASGESELNYNSMVASVHEEALARCTSEGKEFSLVDTKKEYGSTGWFGPMQRYAILFRCI